MNVVCRFLSSKKQTSARGQVAVVYGLINAVVGAPFRTTGAKDRYAKQ